MTRSTKVWKRHLEEMKTLTLAVVEIVKFVSSTSQPSKPIFNIKCLDIKLVIQSKLYTIYNVIHVNVRCIKLTTETLSKRMVDLGFVYLGLAVKSSNPENIVSYLSMHHKQYFDHGFTVNLVR